MAWGRALAVLAAALALAGCYENRSDVPAISDARRLANSPIAPGIWCGTDVTFDTADAVTDLKLENCFTARFEAGVLTVEKLHPEDGDRNDEPVVFVMAALNRGATMLQIRSEVDNRYELYVAKTSKDGIAVLPELKLTPFMRWLDEGVQFDYGSIVGTEAAWAHLYGANSSVIGNL